MFLDNFSSRLKEERIKLSLSQAELGELCGVKKLAQFNYEKGERFPDANYLMQAIKVGVDVNYLLTGNRSTSALSADEVFMLDKIRQASFETRNKILMLLLGSTDATSNVVRNKDNTVQSQQVGDNNHQENHHKTSQKSSVKVKKNDGNITGIHNG